MITELLQEMIGVGLIVQVFIQAGIVQENLLYVRLDVEMVKLQV